MRNDILNGKLQYPGTAMLLQYPDKADDILAFWKALWMNCLAGNDTNGVKWYEILGGKLYNDLTRRLSHHGWIECDSIPIRKWLSVRINQDKLLEFVSQDEWNQVKTRYQYQKYTLECNESKYCTFVRQNGKTKRTGLIRAGFRDAGNTQFGYDMAKLEEYEAAVKANLTKSMDKVREFYPEMKSEDFSYDKVSIGIFDMLNSNREETYTTGDSLSDSRGRAISQSLKKIANPISCKDFRAALVITYEE